MGLKITQTEGDPFVATWVDNGLFLEVEADRAAFRTLVPKVEHLLFRGLSDGFRRSLGDGGVFRLSVGDKLAKHRLLESL
jgi:hypothetical protein